MNTTTDTTPGAYTLALNNYVSSSNIAVTPNLGAFSCNQTVYQKTISIHPLLGIVRSSLTTITATAMPMRPGGMFTIDNSDKGQGPKPPYVQFASGVLATDNPVTLAVVTQPSIRNMGGSRLIKVTYQVNGQAPIATGKAVPVTEFHMTCYACALESEWGDPQRPATCKTVRIYGVTYSGLSGARCASYLAEVRLNGCGRNSDGSQTQYNSRTKTFVTVANIKTSDGTIPIPRKTLARDRAIIPGLGVLVDVDTPYGDSLAADDTGGKIIGYHLDFFGGYGARACVGFGGADKIGRCHPSQGLTCPVGDPI